ncbi:uncharacterized protein LOC129324030 [Eublepharis macularius]|uniref:ribonuclease H n=1 Tax=Eublepharis macularius TaxID=481883 RepID=A0AA97KPR2_EUBMA|nr:uncharacterized protein LOC129324030 [Eublepharis macularius]
MQKSIDPMILKHVKTHTTMDLKEDGRLESRRQARALRHPPPPWSLPEKPAEPTPVGVPCNRLPPEEKERRRNHNLCWYCGGVGHYADGCPAKRRTLAISLESAHPKPLVGTASASDDPPEPFLVPVKLCLPDGRWLFVYAMIDSGASRCFMDAKFAAQHQIPLRAKKNPTVVEVIDGRPLRSGPVVEETQDLLLQIQRHQERLCFDVVGIPQFPLVLGLSWFCRHDPIVRWGQLDLHFREPCPHENPCPRPMVAAALEVSALPEEYVDLRDVFEEKGADQLPPHRPYDCTIDLIPGAPLPLRDFLTTNLRRGFICPSTSPTSAPVLFVKKKNGELRLCNDYRALNKISIRDRYPLPLIPDLLEQVKGAQIYTKLDLRGAYNLVRIREGDEWKTAFSTRYGQYEYLVMPFGLTNAPAVFQRLMNDIFRDILDQFVIVYLDDILIYSRDASQHTRHVRTVLQRLRQHGLFAKLEKCAFHRPTVEFLGHVLSPHGIRMDPAKVEAVQTWQAPRSRKDVQRFLGFANYYRQFIPGLLHPLPTPTGPWRTISMDFITDLPCSKGHTCILVVVDLFTKMAHFIPCSGPPTAQETAHLYLQHVFRLHGRPDHIISDRGVQFTSRFWRALHSLLGTQVHLSSAHHPQSDGQTERINATLEQYLRCYTNHQQDDWLALLPLAEFAYNNAVHSSTQQTVVREKLEDYIRNIDLLLQKFSNTAGCWVNEQLRDTKNWNEEYVGALTKLVSERVQTLHEWLEVYSQDLSAWLNTNFGSLHECHDTHTKDFGYELGTEILAHDECSEEYVNLSDTWLDQPTDIALYEWLGEALVNFYQVLEIHGSNVSSSLEDYARTHIQLLEDHVEILEQLWDSYTAATSMWLEEQDTAEEASFQKYIWNFLNAGPETEEQGSAEATAS